jgi:hypothetical protein
MRTERYGTQAFAISGEHRLLPQSLAPGVLRPGPFRPIRQRLVSSFYVLSTSHHTGRAGVDEVGHALFTTGVHDILSAEYIDGLVVGATAPRGWFSSGMEDNVAAAHSCPNFIFGS